MTRARTTRLVQGELRDACEVAFAHSLNRRGSYASCGLPRAATRHLRLRPSSFPPSDPARARSRREQLSRRGGEAHGQDLAVDERATEVRFHTRNDLVAACRLDACSAPLGAPATEEATIARHANRCALRSSAIFTKGWFHQPADAETTLKPLLHALRIQCTSVYLYAAVPVVIYYTAVYASRWD